MKTNQQLPVGYNAECLFSLKPGSPDSELGPGPFSLCDSLMNSSPSPSILGFSSSAKRDLYQMISKVSFSFTILFYDFQFYLESN